MSTLQIRKTDPDELPLLLTLFDHSRQLMRASGNLHQWVDGYPQISLIAADIAAGQSYVVTDNENVVGTFVFLTDPEPTYQTIYHGHWLDDKRPYGTLHRMARAEGCHGVADAALRWCATQCESLRADTHKDNHIVQHILRQHYFVYCGMIRLNDGSWRKAYQKLTYPTVDSALRQHVETMVLPQYDLFDAGHDRQHALTVIAHSMALAQHYPVDANMVYAIAAYHDVGLSEGRATHHLVSGRSIRSDSRLRQWFDDNQIETIAQAAEDHRASSENAPRSIYGRIVAEADRDIDSEKIVLRTLQYGWRQYPQLNREEQWQRMVAHLEEKYAEGGYLRLWLEASPNKERLAELRALIADKKALRNLFDRLQRPDQ